MKHILIATDLSSPARLAANRAAQLAHAAGARLQLVHALDAGAAAQLQQLLGVESAFEATLIEHTREELKTLAAELAAIHQVEVEPTLMQGPVVGEISRESERTPADHGIGRREGTRRFVGGGTRARERREPKRRNRQA